MVDEVRSMAREFQDGDGCACFDGFLYDVVAVGFVERICAFVWAINAMSISSADQGDFRLGSYEPTLRWARRAGELKKMCSGTQWLKQHLAQNCNSSIPMLLEISLECQLQIFRSS